MAERKYFWIKLSKAFFESKEVKKLRRLAGGDTYVIIYLKMQILSLENGGKLYFDGLEDSFAEELALALDESVNNIQMTLAFMQRAGLIEQRAADEFFMPEVLLSIGSETSAASRMRKMRERNKVTSERNNVTPMLQDRYGDIELDIELELESDIELESEIESEKESAAGEPAAPNAKNEKKKSTRFVKPTIEQVRAYCEKIQSSIDADYFYDHYEANGWKVGGKAPMKDWQATVRNWERNGYSSGRKEKKPNVDMSEYKAFINQF